MGNKALHRAKRDQDDEFYTRYETVEEEVKHYAEHFKGKKVFCNTDTATSAFVTYFKWHYHKLGLAGLYVYGLGLDEAWKYDGHTFTSTLGQGDGRFQSELSQQTLAEVDIVVTNPPFSQFREFFTMLNEAGKKYLVLGNLSAVTYQEVWPYLKNGLVWMGVNNKAQTYDRPDGATQKLGSTVWFTNLDHPHRHEPLPLTETYNPDNYPMHDNFPAIEVSRVARIPKDYSGVMAVPITYMSKHCPEQFEILGCSYIHGMPDEWVGKAISMSPAVNGRGTYKRIFIRRR